MFGTAMRQNPGRLLALLFAACAISNAAEASPLGMATMHEHRALQPFGLKTTRDRGLLPKWRAITNALPDESKILADCREHYDQCPAGARAFLEIVDVVSAMPESDRIAGLNRLFNESIRPVDDMTQYGVRDYWATPIVTLASGAGDCEDYAIAKYLALRQIGITTEDLRIVVVRDRFAGENHAVAAVRDLGRWFILDNKSDVITSDDATTRIAPLYVLDDTGVVATRPPYGN